MNGPWLPIWYMANAPLFVARNGIEELT